MNTRLNKSVYGVFLLLFLVPNVWAQTTAFNYQGRLTEGGNPANGAYQMQFKLFDALAGGSQIGATLNDVPVTVTNGVFSTKLDFGSNALSGANRWLEIAVRHSSSEFYTILSPREQIASSPYAVRTLSAASADNALNLGGIPASEYVTNSSVGSSFIRNSTAPQSASFNIIGSGILGILGIGTSNPIQLLHIKSQTGFNAASLVEAPAGFFAQYQLESGADNPWIIGTQDNFANGALLFRKGATDFMAIRQTGNIGIGTTSPIARLTINGTGLNGQSLNVSGDAGFGGNVTQVLSAYGLPKAMVFVRFDGRITDCYNGLTGASLRGGTTNTGCDFSVNHFASGGYGIDFGFQVKGRWAIVTAYGGNGTNYGANYIDGAFSNTVLDVRTFFANVVNGNTDASFTIIVY